MRRILLALFIAALLPPVGALAQSGANVLLVVNESSPDSGRIAEHYARVRAVPADQVVRISVGTGDEIDRAGFNDRVQAPIATWLRQHGAQDRILYIVLTKGVPLRVKGTAGRDGTTASVDSELTLLYRRLSGYAAAIDGRLANPYYLGGAPLSQARRFSREAFDLFLVTRLDGYTADDAIALIDRGAAPSDEGVILLDQRAGGGTVVGNDWLAAAAARLGEQGFADRVVLETTGDVLTGRSKVLGYYSWGSNDEAITMRRFGFGFVPGAIAGTYVSTDGRTFNEPPAEWAIGKWIDRRTHFAGSPQSMAGDLIREGVTGIAAHVDEPYLDATVRPDILFPAYVAGFNLAESFYLAMPFLSWRTIVVGDPLCAPFPRRALQPAEIDAGVDPATELPALFAARRMRAVPASTPPEVAKALLRAEVRTVKGDTAGAREALEQATALEPRNVAAQLALAGVYETQKEWGKAVERYRAALAVSPDNAVALNNLAYTLAVRMGQPAEALPHAQRAVALTGGRSPEVADTLAWTQHLLGQDAAAAPVLERIVKAVPARPEYRVHLASVYAALGRLDEARSELKEAARLDPELDKGDDVKALKAKLGRL